MLLIAFERSALYFLGSLWFAYIVRHMSRQVISAALGRTETSRAYLAALTSAPASMSIWTTRSLPELAAMCMGRTPLRTLLTGCPCMRAYLTRPDGNTGKGHQHQPEILCGSDAGRALTDIAICCCCMELKIRAGVGELMVSIRPGQAKQGKRINLVCHAVHGMHALARNAWARSQRDTLCTLTSLQ